MGVVHMLMLRAVVARAFQVLSDPEKKAKFDKFGGDPDARFNPASSAGASPFSNFARAQRGPMYEEEISPEEMFRQFFGGGGPFGGPFGAYLHASFVSQKTIGSKSWANGYIRRRL